MFYCEKLIKSQEGRLIISCGIIFNFLPNIFYFVINMADNKKFRDGFTNLSCITAASRKYSVINNKRFSSIFSAKRSSRQ